MKAFDTFAEALMDYCRRNNLDFEKVKNSPKCGNDTVVMIQRIHSPHVGLEQETLAEVLLVATKDECGRVRIKQSPGAEKHLSF